MSRKALTEGSLLMCAVVLIWGAFLPVSKVVLPVVDPYWLTLLRYGVAAVCFLVALACLEGGQFFALFSDHRGRGFLSEWAIEQR